MVTQGNTKLVSDCRNDDDSMRSALQGLLQSAELPAQSFASAERIPEVPASSIKLHV